MIGAGKKANNLKSGAAAAHKKAKQDEAKFRQEAYSKMTLVERLHQAESRGGSKKEIAKIQAAMQAQKK